MELLFRFRLGMDRKSKMPSVLYFYFPTGLLLQTWIATEYAIFNGRSKIGDQKTVAEILFHWRLG